MKYRKKFLLTSSGICILLALALSIPYILPTPLPELFLVRPYLQLGDHSRLNNQEALTLIWQTPDEEATWGVDLKATLKSKWQKAQPFTFRKMSLPLLKQHRIYTAHLSGLTPGETFAYRITRNNTIVFAAFATARKRNDQPFTFVAVGDLASGAKAQKKVAYEMYRTKPDIVLLCGDLVYRHGRISEYWEKFFPVYNNMEVSPFVGAPLMQSTIFIASPGNHDIGTTGNTKVRNLNLFPDGMAYFILWDQPLNGPLPDPDSSTYPVLLGAQAYKDKFLQAAGKRYPRMANFSFDYGGAHFLALDGNDYTNWLDPKLRSWLEKDLAAAQDRPWRFVFFHQSPFGSGKGHFLEQRMRLLADLFQKWKVDLVFSGHMHNYQRTYPLYFQVQPDLKSSLQPTGAVFGTFKLDIDFDGKTRNTPQGVIYIVTGGGGAKLTGAAEAQNPAAWQPYTNKFIAQKHSFTLCSVKNKSLVVRQISEDGDVLDQFKITK